MPFKTNYWWRRSYNLYTYILSPFCFAVEDLRELIGIQEDEVKGLTSTLTELEESLAACVKRAYQHSCELIPVMQGVGRILGRNSWVVEWDGIPGPGEEEKELKQILENALRSEVDLFSTSRLFRSPTDGQEWLDWRNTCDQARRLVGELRAWVLDTEPSKGEQEALMPWMSQEKFNELLAAWRKCEEEFWDILRGPVERVVSFLEKLELQGQSEQLCGSALKNLREAQEWIDCAELPYDPDAITLGTPVKVAPTEIIARLRQATSRLR